MSYLDRLKNLKSPDGYATKPTKPILIGSDDATKPTKPGFVGFVATLPGTFENSLPTPAANDAAPGSIENNPAPARPVDWGQGTEPPADVLARLRAKSQAADERMAGAPAADPDRACWPNGPGWNEAETAMFTQRMLQFAGRGLSMADSQRLADRLVTRDRDQDDRRVCMECAYCQQPRCTRWRAAGLGQAQIPAGMLTTLQRCGGFRSWE